MPRSRSFLRLAAVSAFILSSHLSYGLPQAQESGRFASAAQREQVLQPIDDAVLAPIGGAKPPHATAKTDRGALPDDFPLEHVQLLLNRPAELQQQFDQLLVDLHTPGSPRFHKWLTPEQIGEQYGPAPSDIAKLTGWLAAHGFRVNAVLKSGSVVDFAGSNGLLREAFHTEMHNIQLANGEKHVAALQEAQMPAAFHSLVAGFVSLSDFAGRPSHIDGGVVRRYKDGHTEKEAESKAVPDFTSGSGSATSYDVGASDFYTIYDESPLFHRSIPIKGTQQVVVIVGRSQVTASDFTTFRTQFGVSGAGTLKTQLGSAELTCSDPGLVSNDDQNEASLDVEWAGATAPDAGIVLVICASTNTTGGEVLAAEAAVDANLGGSLGMSFNFPESGMSSTLLTTFNNMWQQAAAQGMTAVVATGDQLVDQNDALLGNGFDGLVMATTGPDVSGYASTPWNMAAGGTDFQVSPNFILSGSTGPWISNYWSTALNTASPWESALSYVPETAWNDTCANSIYDAQLTAQNTLDAAQNNPHEACQKGFADWVASKLNSTAVSITGASGGFSNVYTRPMWQAGVYGLATSGNSTARGLPDVSLFSSNNEFASALLYCDSGRNGACTYSSNNSGNYDTANSGGGTSYAAPQLAGIMALIEQSTGERQGQANYVFYALAAKEYGSSTYSGTSCLAAGTTANNGPSPSASYLPAASCIFHDVATGNIDVPCYGGSGSGTTGTSNSPDCFATNQQVVTLKGVDYRVGALSASTTAFSPLYNAAAGWDPATGLGSVDIANLVDSWSGATGSPAYAATITLTDSGLAGKSYTYGTVPAASALVAVITGNGSFPTGTVTFQGSTLIGPIGSTSTTPSGCPGSACEAKASGEYTPVDALPAGSYSLTATFAGGENYAAATSNAISFTVAQQTPTLGAVAFSPISVPYGTATAVTATVKLAYTGAGSAPTGTVNIVLHGTPYAAACTGSSSPVICTATIPGAAVAALPEGAVAATPSYTGDNNYTAVTGTISYLTVAVTFTTSTVYTFDAQSDGSISATGLIQAGDGNFYGYGGGDDDNEDSVFSLSPSGAFKIFYDFNPAVADQPTGELVVGPDGNLYGILAFVAGTPNGDDAGIFRLTPSGGFTILHAFCQKTNCTDGQTANDGLVIGSDGLLWGIASGGGANGYGGVFKMTTSGTYTLVYSFANGGARYSQKLVQASDGNFYGVESGYVIYRLTPTGKYTAIYTENSTDKDGAESTGALVVGPDGALYGSDQSDYVTGTGTVFRMTLAGAYETLHYFSTSGSGGYDPYSPLIVGSDGYLYGTTIEGTSHGEGAGYRIDINGNYSVIDTFCSKTDCLDGSEVSNRYVQGSDGAFYNIANLGGSHGEDASGLVFKNSAGNAIPAPVQLAFSTATAPIGDSVTLNWKVLNAFSLTAQQCYASVQGGATGAGAWTGKQTGIVDGGVLFGTATITPTVAGTYTYALNCGGMESGFATLIAGGKTTNYLINTGSVGNIAAGVTGLIGVDVINAYKPTGNVTYSVPGLGNLAVLPVQPNGATGNYGAPTKGYPPGMYNLTAAYSGDANNSPSTLTIPLTITPNVLITASANPATVSAGQTVTFSASVVPNGYQGPPVEGKVVFSASGATLAAAQVIAGGGAAVSFVVPSGYPAGRYTVDADYVPAAGSTYPANGTTLTVTLQ